MSTERRIVGEPSPEHERRISERERLRRASDAADREAALAHRALVEATAALAAALDGTAEEHLRAASALWAASQRRRAADAAAVAAYRAARDAGACP